MAASRSSSILAGLVGASILVLVWAAAPLRAGLVAVEPVVGPGLFTIGLVMGLGAALARRSGSTALRRRLRRIEGRVLRTSGRHGFWLAAGVFLLPLWSQWAAQPPGSVSAHSALFGVVPWGDASGHYEGGIRLLSEGEFLTYSARRPLHACWLAVRLALGGGSVPVALALQAMVLGLAAFLLSRSLALRLGAWPAVAAFGFVYGFARDYTPAVLTEPIGLTFACLAAAILLTNAARRNAVALAVGFLALDAALRARPGAQFVLPILALWALVFFCGKRRVAFGVLAGIALFGSVYTTALNKLYSSGEATFTSHLAHTLYGLAHGSTYERAQEDLGVDANRAETEVAGGLWRRAFGQIAAQPSVFLGSLWHNESRFLSKAPVAVMRVVSPRWLYRPADERVKPTSEEIRRDKRWGGLVLLVAAFGALAYLRRRPAGDGMFWLAVAAGLLASAPFIYSDTGFRALAPGYPFIAAFFALGAAATRRPRSLAASGEAIERRLVGASGALTAALLALTLVGPFIAHAAWPKNTIPTATSSVDAGVVEMAMSPLVVVRNPLEIETFGSMRTLDRPDFLRLVRFADLKGELDPLTQRRPPFVVMSAYDYANRRVRTLVAPIEMARSGSRRVSIEARPIPGNEALEEVISWELFPKDLPVESMAGPSATPNHQARPQGFASTPSRLRRFAPSGLRGVTRAGRRSLPCGR